MNGAPLTPYPCKKLWLTAVAAFLLILPSALGQTVVSWGSSTGSWNTIGNWTLEALPATNERVAIVGGNASVDSNITVDSISLSSGTISGTADLTLTGSGSTWTSGTMSGSGTTFIDTGATLNITSTSSHNLNGRDLTNKGTINWSQGSISGGNGTIINNATGATFNDLNASSYTIYNPYGGTFVFTNNGTYTRNAAGTTTISTTFDNNGTVNLQQGSIKLTGGGTMSATSVVNVSSGTTFDFANNYTLASGSQLTGTGAIQQTAGTLTVDGTLKASLFDWRNGNWNAPSAATTTIDSTTTLNLSTSSSKGFQKRTISNEGIINWYSGNFASGDGGAFTNASGGTFNDLNASSYSIYNPYGGTFVVTNNGTYTRNATGTTTISTTFDNNGTVNLQQGVLKLTGGGTMSATSVVNVSSGTTFDFANDYTLVTGSQLKGTGTIQQTAGTLTVDGTLKASLFDWRGGNWNAPSAATTTIDPTTTLNLSTTSSKTFQKRTISNEGIINWYSGNFASGNGGAFTNASGATFNDLNASSYSIYNPYGGTFVLTNNGTYTRNAAGTTTISTTFDNNGTVNLQQGTIKLSGGGTMSATSVVNVSSGTTFDFANDYTLVTGSQLKGTGTIQQTAGTLTVDGTLKASLFDWRGGSWSAPSVATTTIDSTTTLNLSTSGSKAFQKRTISNEGIINWYSGNLASGNGGAFTNASGATFNDLNASSYSIYNPYGGTFAFTNNGTYTRNAAGTTQIQTAFENNGSLNVDQGTLRFNSSFNQVGGALKVSSGSTLKFDNGLSLGAGSLAGSGTVEGNVSTSATINPGNPLGELSITGDLTFNSTSVLNIGLGGTTQGTNYDFLDISGASLLQGVLNLSFANGFESTVTSGDTFTILNASALSGTFSNVTNGARLTTTDSLGSFQVNYSSIAVSLSGFQAVPEPSTWALLGLGVLVIGATQYRRYRSRR